MVIDLKVIEHLKKKYLDTGIRQFLFGALNLSCAILLHLHFDKTVAPPKIAFYQYVSKQNYIIANAHNASYGQDAREIHLNRYEHFPGISHNGKEKAVLLQI